MDDASATKGTRVSIVICSPTGAMCPTATSMDSARRMGNASATMDGVANFVIRKIAKTQDAPITAFVTKANATASTAGRALLVPKPSRGNPCVNPTKPVQNPPPSSTATTRMASSNNLTHLPYPWNNPRKKRSAESPNPIRLAPTADTSTWTVDTVTAWLDSLA
uniref:Uncharacterized protein n=1 Tax=Steinernema glaseri TaxID=37863 RepID=A0A1I8ARG2_9BILA